MQYFFKYSEHENQEKSGFCAPERCLLGGYVVGFSGRAGPA